MRRTQRRPRIYILASDCTLEVANYRSDFGRLHFCLRLCFEMSLDGGGGFKG